jgi:antirestriction protein ArdC
MSRHTARARSGSDRTSLYDEITAKIIGELETSGRLRRPDPAIHTQAVTHKGRRICV